MLGLAAPVGVDLHAVAAALRSALHAVSYEAIEINVIDAAAALGKWSLSDEPRYDERANARMTFGNNVRAAIGLDALALVTVGEIQRQRHERNGQADKPIARAAYLIRSLKTPDEVKKLREVYGSSCYIVATYASRDVQLDTLARQIARSHHSASDGFRAQAEALILRDESERGVENGQNLRDTFPLADVFLDGRDNEALKASAMRFVEILFAHPFRTPTKQELGMFFAHGASLRSASPGRQVGACIATKDGDTVSIGTNEVPKAHGGQYWEGDVPDERDHNWSYDSTAALTENTLADLVARLRQKGWLKDNLAKLPLAVLLKAGRERERPQEDAEGARRPSVDHRESPASRHHRVHAGRTRRNGGHLIRSKKRRFDRRLRHVRNHISLSRVCTSYRRHWDQRGLLHRSISEEPRSGDVRGLDRG